MWYNLFAVRKRSKKVYFIIFFIVLIIAFGILLGLNFLNVKPANFNIFKKNQPASKSFTFAVAGDSHNNTETYNEIVQDVNKNNNSFFVDLGDSTRVGGRSEFEQTKAVLAKLNVPYHMVVGNHDTVGDGYILWQEYYGETYYSWDYQNTHFITLNDVVNENGFSEEQLSWLEKDLSSTSKELKFIFLHSPPRCPFVGSEELGFTGPKSEERINQFINIAKKYKVNKMFAGDIHNYLNYSISGIPITVTGGAGGPLYDIPLIGLNKYHYVEVEVSGSNFQQKVIEL